MPVASKNKSENLLVLIDGSSYLYRAFHALPALATSRGEPTGAVYGVINMIRKLLKEYAPTYIAVVFDAKGKNFRHKIYPEYKATRPAMSEDLIGQIKPLRDIIAAMGLPILSVEGVEADDVIGTLAKRAREKDMQVLVATGDKDLAQIVERDITLIDTMSNVLLDKVGVKNKFGVTPELIADYLALIGDQSDNIPGVPKVGPKTAAKWLNTYGSLEEIMHRAGEIEGKVGENLRQSLERLPLARSLVQIKDDVALGLEPQDLIKKVEDKEKLVELFKRYEFRSWLAALLDANAAKLEEEGNYEIILQEEHLQKWLKELYKAAAFAIDIQATDLNFMRAKIVGISFAVEAGKAAYLPLGHDYPEATAQLSTSAVLATLKPLFEDANKIKIGQDLKYDYHVFANYSIELRGIGFDTMLESYIANSTANRHDLETLVLKYLGLKIASIEEMMGKGAKRIAFNKLHLEVAAAFAAKNADLVLRLHEVLWLKIAENANLRKILQEIEMPLLPVLARMEHIGVCIDADFLHRQSNDLAKRIADLENEAYHSAGCMFNLNSPKQLREILFTKLQLPVLEKTPTGQPSTGESVLQELALEFPLPQLILQYRALTKLKSTYTDVLPKQIEAKTGRVHTSYNQAVTATGRLSSTDPNLQNIPARSEEGRRIRQAFIAPPGYKILSADYSQIELRIMAHLSQDAQLLKAFTDAEDIHKATAAEVFAVALKDVTLEQRQRAKAINFGLIYGMSAFGLARQIDVDKEVAQEYMNLYFARYPGVKDYMEKARATARERGYVETIFGRRLYVPDINAQNFQRRSAAERAAINAPMQGSAADIMKLAMIAVDDWIETSRCGVKMLLQVHDELVFEIVEREIASASMKIKQIMQEITTLAVPILVHVGVGDNWEQAH